MAEAPDAELGGTEDPAAPMGSDDLQASEPRSHSADAAGSVARRVNVLAGVSALLRSLQARRLPKVPE